MVRACSDTISAMTPDLLTACVFCGMQLFRSALPSAPGLSAEFGASYSTIERRDDSPTVFHNDASDLTPKFLLVGMTSSREAEGGLGAGTPAREWTAKLALATSHDEASQTFRIADPVVATGTGRYENFEAVGRLPFGASDSLEVGLAQRVHRIVDLVNIASPASRSRRHGASPAPRGGTTRRSSSATVGHGCRGLRSRRAGGAERSPPEPVGRGCRLRWPSRSSARPPSRTSGTARTRP
jgi:hypothetical protein